MAQHGRTYKDAKEKERRFAIFKSNVEYIESFNSALGKDYKLEVNQFADLTNEEFGAFRKGFRRPKAKIGSTKDDDAPFRYENFTDVPSFIDWREKGAVTPVKSQGSCCKKSSLFIMNYVHDMLIFENSKTSCFRVQLISFLFGR